MRPSLALRLALRLAGSLTCAALASSCGPTPKVPGTTGVLSLAVEGPCPKLRVWDAGKELALVYGTYGLEGATPIEARSRLSAEQAFGFLRTGGIELRPAMYAGLPRNARGYVPLDLDLGGPFPQGAWLSRVDTRLAKANQGALFERSRGYFVWEGGRWTESPTGSDVVLSGLRTPPFVEGRICTRLGEGIHFARHATERLPSGAVILAGRCEDDLQRAKGGVIAAMLGESDPNGRWSIVEMPPSPMFDEIVNVDLVYASRSEAWLYAYTPYDETPRPAYVQRFDGSRWAPEELPFPGPIASMARTSDGVVWAVARFRELYARAPGTAWKRIPIPEARFADRPPTDLRIIELQAVGNDVFVHAAYPIVLRDGAGEPRPSRSHMLFTTRPWRSPLFCDASQPAITAVNATGRTLEVAQVAHVKIEKHDHDGSGQLVK
ncbi:MAG: hypothetical protein JST00_20215 [Deltaproteobacteria bacterium]|nr:hypothetical protein [Deltaproteobacteria bacterium]